MVCLSELSIDTLDQWRNETAMNDAVRIARLEMQVAGLQRDTEDHEQRLRIVEHSNLRLAILVGTVGALLTTVLTLVGHYFVIKAP